MRIGIPRALFYYYLYPWWKTFFDTLGMEVETSSPTSRRTAARGIETTVSEACYPVKVFYGHVMELAGREVDWIFVPRLVSIEPRMFICPKFMGLPDMLRAQLPDLPPLLDLCVDLTRGRNLKDELKRCAGLLQCRPAKVEKAWNDAGEVWRDFQKICRRNYILADAIKVWEGKEVQNGARTDLRLGLLGHCYTLNDDIVNLGILQHLADLGATPVTAEMRDPLAVDKAAATLPKRMFWTVGRTAVGAALEMDADPDIDGIIYLACFGCGPDSMVTEVIENRVVKPFLLLTVDEHTGEAGMITRLEAFCDMLRGRRQSESDLSPYGQHVDRGQDPVERSWA